MAGWLAELVLHLLCIAVKKTKICKYSDPDSNYRPLSRTIGMLTNLTMLPPFLSFLFIFNTNVNNKFLESNNIPVTNGAMVAKRSSELILVA
jgi:hypothetical protein